jgi:hypothetical protein
MKVQEAIMAFSQSEKIKAGLIWVSQSLQLLNSISESERPGAEKVSKAMIGMIVHEIQLGKNVTGDASWEEVSKHIDRAMVMIDSGVAAEAVVNLTQALSQVTSLGHRSMSFLKEEGLL